MTVTTTSYAPVVTTINADLEYPFAFPYSEDISIEVFEILNTGQRVRVDAQDFTLSTSTPFREPTKQGGVIAFNRPHGSTVEEVSVERNTLIVQNADLPVVDALNTRMVEYTLDRLTLILQELASRKCATVTGVTVDQRLVFGSYFALPAASIDAALDKLTAIALAIDTTAEDCRGRPEDT